MNQAVDSQVGIPWNGKFTIRNIESGEHRTFRIRTQPDDAKFAPGERILSLLTGPDNTNDYQSFAFVGENSIVLFKRYRSEPGDPKTQHEKLASLIVYVVSPLMRVNGRTICFGDAWGKNTYDLHFERKCRRCNRTLTTPESIESGIGPICAGRV